jgi:hypothetical protein
LRPPFALNLRFNWFRTRNENFGRLVKGVVGYSWVGFVSIIIIIFVYFYILKIF